MSTNLLHTIDGRNLYYVFLAGAQKIFQHQSDINQINVFPVSDHDTGTNLVSTMRSVTASLRPQPSIKKTANLIAESALVGARGNSGIIFAQFLYGFSTEMADQTTLTLSELAGSLRKSIDHVYQAVSDPVEGTMLTVMREWADFLYQHKTKFRDFKQAIVESMEILNRSLQQTKNKLDVLSKHNVVDAGAKGFVLFVEGIFDLIRHGNIRHLRRTLPAVPDEIAHETDAEDQSITYRYCTEALIKGEKIDKGQIRKIASEYGDSMVIAGSDKQVRLHIHTDKPANLFQDLRPLGTLAYQKADDMYLQYQVAHERKYNIALVTDSTCDLPEDLLEKYQIHRVPINIQVDESIYLDKLTLEPDTFYKLSGEAKSMPTTSQPNEKSFVNLYSHLATHYDSVIAVHISEQLSGTWSSSSRAAKRISTEMGKNISVINSRTISGSLGMLVLRVAEAIEQGMEHDSILRKIDEWITNQKIYVSVKSLDNIVRSGRVSPLTGIIAKALNLKPIISLGEDGKAIMFDKAFSQEGNIRKVLKHIKKDLTKGNLWNYVIVHALNEEGAEKLASTLEKITGKPPRFIINVCSALVLHAGNGTVAVGLIKE